MAQKRNTVTPRTNPSSKRGPGANGGAGRRPFYTMLAIIAAMLVICGVSIGYHLNEGAPAEDGQSAQETSQEAQETAQQSSEQAAQETPARAVKPVGKAKTRKQLVKIAGKGKKGKWLSVIGSSYPVDSAAVGEVKKRVKAIEKKYKVGFVMVDVKTGQGLAYNPSARFYCASAIKGPYVVALNKWERDSIGSYERELMTNAIEVSDNKSYERLHGTFGSGVTQKMMRYSGATSFKPEYSYGYGSARDFARFWIANYWYFFEDTNGSSKWCRNLFDSVNESFVHQALKSEHKTYSKAGWFPGDEFDNVHNDAGIVMCEVQGESRPYVIAVMSTAYGDEKQLRSLVRAIDAVHEDMMYE